MYFIKLLYHVKTNVEVKDDIKTNVEVKDDVKTNIEVKDDTKTNVEVKDDVKTNIEVKEIKEIKEKVLCHICEEIIENTNSKVYYQISHGKYIHDECLKIRMKQLKYFDYIKEQDIKDQIKEISSFVSVFDLKSSRHLDQEHIDREVNLIKVRVKNIIEFFKSVIFLIKFISLRFMFSILSYFVDLYSCLKLPYISTSFTLLEVNFVEVNENLEVGENLEVSENLENAEFRDILEVLFNAIYNEILEKYVIMVNPRYKYDYDLLIENIVSDDEKYISPTKFFSNVILSIFGFYSYIDDNAYNYTIIIKELMVFVSLFEIFNIAYQIEYNKNYLINLLMLISSNFNLYNIRNTKDILQVYQLCIVNKAITLYILYFYSFLVGPKYVFYNFLCFIFVLRQFSSLSSEIDEISEVVYNSKFQNKMFAIKVTNLKNQENKEEYQKNKDENQEYEILQI